MHLSGSQNMMMYFNEARNKQTNKNKNKNKKKKFGGKKAISIERRKC